MTRYILAFAVLMGAASAWAIAGSNPAWSTQPDGTQVCGGVQPSGGGVFGGRNQCYYDFTANQDSNPLDVSRCAEFAVDFNPDEDGTNTGAEVYIWRCNENTDATKENACSKLLNDTDGDGIVNDVTLDGSTVMRQGFTHAQANYIVVDVTAVAGTPDDARVTVTCY